MLPVIKTINSITVKYNYHFNTMKLRNNRKIVTQMYSVYFYLNENNTIHKRKIK